MFTSSPIARLGWVVLVLMLCLVLPACGKKKVTKANFDQIQNDMTLAEVEKVLGAGTKQEGDGSTMAAQFGVALTPAPSTRTGETYQWESGNKTITIFFNNGKVASKTQSGL
jgi:hypothetical protein